MIQGFWRLASTSKKTPIPILLGFFSTYILVSNFVNASYDFFPCIHLYVCISYRTRASNPENSNGFLILKAFSSSN